MTCMTAVCERGEKTCSGAHGTAISRWQLACVCLSVVAITLSLFTLFWVHKIVQDLEQNCGCEVRERADEGHFASVASISGSSGLQDVGTRDIEPDTDNVKFFIYSCALQTTQLVRRDAGDEEEEAQSRIKRAKGNRDKRKFCKKVTNCMKNDTDTYGFFDALTVIGELRQNVTQEVQKLLTRSYIHRVRPDDVEMLGTFKDVQGGETVLSVKVAPGDIAERSGDEGMTTIQGGGLYLVYGQLTYNRQMKGKRLSYNGPMIVISDKNGNSDRFLSCLQPYPVNTTGIPTSCFTAGVVPLQQEMRINLTASVMGEIYIDDDKTFLGAVKLAELPPEPSDGG
uniref:THD domain-containing protein n=1 Tax=Branchiostoma floridae TaxID=7739 RepID=C3Z7S9_BRAFL|eukprot:XP_002595422.1 hypothetical protein BRAFLDRAFT_69253 [Branchiostoma floridae]